MDSVFAEQVEEIENYLRQIAGVVRRKGRVMLEDYKITPPQFDALLILNYQGVLTIGDLSNKLYLAYSTTTDLVDRLERAEFVVRERDTVDRRVVRVKMQTKGTKLIEEVLDARRAYLAGILESMDRDNIDEILRVLHLLNDKMTQS